MLAIFALAVWAINKYVINLSEVVTWMDARVPQWVIIGILFISESFVGLLPPDAFIAWAKAFNHPYLMVLILAFASYMGGVVSWVTGTQLHRLARVKNYVDVKFAEQFLTFKKYGGMVIFISALTPLPFSPISVVAGVVGYPLKSYLLVALARYIRFFLYAYFIFQVF